MLIPKGAGEVNVADRTDQPADEPRVLDEERYQEMVAEINWSRVHSAALRGVEGSVAFDDSSMRTG